MKNVICLINLLDQTSFYALFNLNKIVEFKSAHMFRDKS